MSTTPETPSRRRRIVPGGIVDLKRRLGRQGGLAGVGVGAGLAAFGALVLFATDGAFLGAIGYLIVLAAFLVFGGLLASWLWLWRELDRAPEMEEPENVQRPAKGDTKP